MLINYTVQEKQSYRSSIALTYSSKLVAAKVLQKPLKNILISRLDEFSFDEALSYYPYDEDLYQRIIKEFSSRRYLRENRVVDFLRIEEGQKFIERLEKEQQIILGFNIVISARGSGWTAKSYLNELRLETKQTNNYIKTGILLGSIFSSANYMWINSDTLKSTIQLINKLDDHYIIEAFDTVKEHIEKINSTAKYNLDEIDKLLAQLIELKHATSAKLFEVREIIAQRVDLQEEDAPF